MPDPGGEHYGTASDFSNPRPLFDATKFTNFDVFVGHPPPPPPPHPNPHKKQRQQQQQQQQQLLQMQQHYHQQQQQQRIRRPVAADSHRPQLPSSLMIMEHPQDLPALKNHDPILNSRSDEDDEDDEEYDDDRPVIPAPPVPRDRDSSTKTPCSTTTPSSRTSTYLNSKPRSIPFPLTPKQNPDKKKNKKNKTPKHAGSSSTTSVPGGASVSGNKSVASRSTGSSGHVSRSGNGGTARGRSTGSRGGGGGDSVSTSTSRRNKTRSRSRGPPAPPALPRIAATTPRPRSRSLLRASRQNSSSNASTTTDRSEQQRSVARSQRSLSRNRRGERLVDPDEVSIATTTVRVTSPKKRGFFRKLGLFGKRSSNHSVDTDDHRDDHESTALASEVDHKSRSSNSNNDDNSQNNNASDVVRTNHHVIDATVRDVVEEEHRSLFFATDEVSTLTNPTIDPDPLATTSRSVICNNHNNKNSRNNDKSEYDGAMGNYWRSDGAIDPFPTPFFAEPDGASPAIRRNKTKKQPTSVFLHGSSPRIAKLPPPSSSSDPRRGSNKDPSPRGDGSTVTTKAETNASSLARGVSPLRHHFQNATPRQRKLQQQALETSSMPSPLQSQSLRDPVGESPIHQKQQLQLQQKQQSRNDQMYPDPPLYLQHLDSSNSDSTEAPSLRRQPLAGNQSKTRTAKTIIGPRSKLNAKAAALLNQRSAMTVLNQKSSSSLFNSYTNGKFRDRKLVGGGSVQVPKPKEVAVQSKVVLEKPQSYSKAVSVSTTRRFKDRHLGGGKLPPAAGPVAMERNVEITTFVASKGFDLFRYQRAFDIEMGRSKRVVPMAQPKPVAKSYRITRPYQEPTDPLQKAGLRILAKAAIPIQCAFRRYMAQRRAVDRMWALIEIQSYFRRWRSEAALLASIVSAVTIQAIARGFVARTDYKRQWQAAIQMQRMIRGYLTAVSTFGFVYRIVIVQACARGWVTRLRINRQIAAAEARMETECAARIQTWWRSRSCHLLYQFLVVDTILAQTAARRFIAKRRVDSMRVARVHSSSTKIQASWRGHRQYTTFIRYWATVRIQKTWRGYVAFSYVQAMVCAIKIQTNWRRFRDESAYQHYTTTKRKATMIQASWRRYREESTYNAYVSTVKIQTMWRCFCEKVKYKQYLATRTIQATYRRFDAMKNFKRETSAIKIQATWRGFQGYTDFIFCLVDILLLQRSVRKWLATREVARIRAAHWSAAATTIQSVWRMYSCVNALRSYKAATVIQSNWRCYSGYTNYIYLLADVIRMQCAVRAWFCRLELKGRRVFYAAQTIQAKFRGFVALRCYTEYVAARTIQTRFRGHVLNKAYTQFVAASLIQARFRGHIAKEVYTQFVAARLIQARCRAFSAARSYARFKAARVIQKHWRGYSAYVDLIITIANAMIIQRNFRKYLVRKDMTTKSDAATTIQSIWRGHQTRGIVIEALISDMEKEEAATTIQTFWRSVEARCLVVEALTSIVVLQGVIRRHHAIRAVQMPRALALARLEVGAATRVQSCWRGIKSSKAFKTFLAARTIQSIWRGHCVHRCYQQYMSATRIARNWRGFKTRQAMISSKAATMIQANWRRHQREECYTQYIAARTIQSSWRGYCVHCCYIQYVSARRITSNWKRYKAHQSYKQRTAATLLQSHWRGSRIARTYRRYVAARVIQTRWRSFAQFCRFTQYISTRRIQTKFRGFVAHKSYRRTIAARTIQTKFRGFVAHKSYRRTIAARRIQTKFRGSVAHKSYRRTIAARRIQTKFRGSVAHKSYRRTIAARTIQTKWKSYSAHKVYNQIRAAIRIQAVWRGCQGWIVYNEFKAARSIQQVWRRSLARTQLSKHRAAQQIQSKWRSYWQQKHYMLLVRETVRLQGMARTKRDRKEFGKHRWSCVLIQTVARRFLAFNKVVILQMPDLLQAVKAQAMREKIASGKIQFWWRVVLDCQKEKDAALKIERFFLKIKYDVEAEIKRQAEKSKSKKKSDRRSRHSSKERSGKVQSWADDAPEDPPLFSNPSGSSSDIFSFSSGHSRQRRSGPRPIKVPEPSPESRLSSEPLPATPFYITESPERAVRRSRSKEPSACLRQSIGRSSPTRNLIMRHEYDGRTCAADADGERTPSIIRESRSLSNSRSNRRVSIESGNAKPDPSPTKRPSSTRSSASVERARAIARSHRQEEPKTVEEAYLNAASFKAKEKRNSIDRYIQKYGIKTSAIQPPDPMERFNAKKKYAMVPKTRQEPPPTAVMPFDRCMADDLESLDDSTLANVDEGFAVLSPVRRSRPSKLASPASSRGGIPPLSTRASVGGGGSSGRRRPSSTTHGKMRGVMSPYPDISVTQQRNNIGDDLFITDESLEVGEEFGMI